MSLRPARVFKGVRLEQVCLPSKDCPLEEAAGAALRSACWWLHIPGLNALFCVTVGRWGESLVQVWKHPSSLMMSSRLEKDHSERGVDTDLFWYWLEHNAKRQDTGKSKVWMRLITRLCRERASPQISLAGNSAVQWFQEPLTKLIISSFSPQYWSRYYRVCIFY